MTWTAPKITAAQFMATICPGTCAPMLETIPLALPINFSSLVGVEVFRGVYTPKNDYLYLFQGRPLDLSPCFMIVLCDAQLNITRTLSSGGSLSEPFQRFSMLSWVLDSANFVNSMYFEGRTNVGTPMPQNAPVAYTVIAGQGIVS